MFPVSHILQTILVPNLVLLGQALKPATTLLIRKLIEIDEKSGPDGRAGAGLVAKNSGFALSSRPSRKDRQNPSALASGSRPDRKTFQPVVIDCAHSRKTPRKSTVAL
jgi:hypothetical protein